MKETKYISDSGFEDENTFTQFDQFENPVLKGSKNRYIYDFSNNADNLNPVALYTNSQYDGVLSSYGDFGAPGKKVLFISDPTTNSTYNSITNAFDVTVVDVAGYDELGNVVVSSVPYFDENTLGYLENRDMLTWPAVSNTINSFRSGYFEISFKTSKQNCIIAKGNSQYDSERNSALYGRQRKETMQWGINLTTETANFPTSINDGQYFKSEKNSFFNTTEIALKNGILTLAHKDIFGDNSVIFEMSGNKNVADNQWHHVVVNFGRPGLLKNASTKFNEKFIEFWVDGKLDKRVYETEGQQQLFYSPLLFILADPDEIISQRKPIDAINSFDPADGSGTIYDSDIGDREFDGIKFIDGLTIMNNQTSRNFKGAVHTIAHGLNVPLNYNEISQRYRYWKYIEKYNASPITCVASLVNPTITTNMKKALKLYWNNLDLNKNGIELDNNYIVDSYCITHKTKNSVSEIYNVDIASKKTLNLLSDVKVALKDNVMIWGPGLLSIANTYIPLLTDEAFGTESVNQINPADLTMYDATVNKKLYKQSPGTLTPFVGPLYDLTISGLNLTVGERILLTNQIKPRQNGIWIFNGFDKPLTRPADFNSSEKINNSVVYVQDGYHKNTYWYIENDISNMDDKQIWTSLDSYNENLINIEPKYESRWIDSNGNTGFINLQEDINLSKYDLICFMNYPETNEEIKNHFINEDDFYVMTKYNEFISSIKNAAAVGANLYVSSPKLAVDLGIIKQFTAIDQSLQSGDLQSSSISPFEASEPAERYFDTHRINKYHLATTLTGLTNKETYLLTDFINYIPEDVNENEQYHAKYVYRQSGLNQGDEFIIPGLSLRQIQNSDKLPGYIENQRNVKPLIAIDPVDINVGTVVTKLSNTYYVGSTVTTNPYDDFTTTLVVHNGQLLSGQPINGKIFVNFVEDGYTLSRKEYNKAAIQTIPQNDINESTATRAWQYSTTRLNREPRKINLRSMTKYGQTTPTNGGGGAIIQAPTNSSNGIIRSLTDSGNIDYQSDLYTSQSEEIYAIQEIPVLSMTFLGLQWLAE